MQKAFENFIDRIHAAQVGSSDLKRHTISVGWVDPEKKHPKKKGRGKGKRKEPHPQEEGGEFSLVHQARMLNYGRAAGVSASGHKYPAIPARPFVKNCIENHLGPIRRLVQTMARDMLDRKKAPMDSREQLDKIGLMCKGAMQRSIKDSNAYAPNSPMTIKAKGSARPLIDTGILVNSIDYEIKG